MTAFHCLKFQNLPTWGRTSPGTRWPSYTPWVSFPSPVTILRTTVEVFDPPSDRRMCVCVCVCVWRLCCCSCFYSLVGACIAITVSSIVVCLFVPVKKCLQRRCLSMAASSSIISAFSRHITLHWFTGKLMLVGVLDAALTSQNSKTRGVIAISPASPVPNLTLGTL
jgi:hypothetical protein